MNTRTFNLSDDDATRANPAAPIAVALDPARLPSLAATTARQHRLAVDERLRALLSHELSIAGWTVGTRDVVDPARAAVVRIRWGAHHASVRVDVSQHPGLASILKGGEPAHAGLRNAVAAIVLAPLLRAFEKLGIDGVEIMSLDRAAPLNLSGQRCAIAFRIGAKRIDTTIDDIDGGWLDALEALVGRQCTPLATHVSEITVPGHLQIGEKTMSIAALDALRPGDVILRAISKEMSELLKKSCASARTEIVWGRHGTRQLRALADVTLDSLKLTEDPRMSYDVEQCAPFTDAADAPVDISYLDLPLKLEIDAVSMPVAQLSALRAGYVLELPTDVTDARIRLVTYGQTIGFGELVSVGDHLGVRLVQISQSHGSV